MRWSPTTCAPATSAARRTRRNSPRRSSAGSADRRPREGGGPISMRSKLFVPGSRPELFAKAMAGRADALSFDLEDAVDESRKAEARREVAQFLRQLPANCGKTIIV